MITSSHAKSAFAAITVLCAPALAASVTPGGGGADARLVWERVSHDLGAWPNDLQPEVTEVLDAWSAFAQERGYRMDLDAEARVLTLSSAESNRSIRRWEELVEDTLLEVDILAPFTSPSRLQDNVSATILHERLQGERPGPIVLVRLADRSDREALIADLAIRHPGLVEAGALQMDGPGLLLRQPCCAAWLEGDLNDNDWKPRNELVARLTRLVLDQRFGALPTWLEEGIAWRIEGEVLRTLNSRPLGTDGNVELEARGYESDLSKHFRRRELDAVHMQDLSHWERGTWDEQRAAMAWGAVTHLAEARQGCLGAFCTELTLQGDVMRLKRGHGDWNSAESVTTDTQHRALLRTAGSTVLGEWADYFATGRMIPRAR